MSKIYRPVLRLISLMKNLISQRMTILRRTILLWTVQRQLNRIQKKMNLDKSWSKLNHPLPKKPMENSKPQRKTQK